MTASTFDAVQADPSLQPIDWLSIECALHTWVTTTLGFDDERVIWEEQNITQPLFPYISMKKSALIEGGGGMDELRTSTDLSRDLGEEIELLSTSPREFTLSLQAHVDEEQGANNPNSNSVKFLSKLQSSVDQVSVHSIFQEAGLAVIERLAVQDISIVLNGQYINRANFDMRLRTTSIMTEHTGFVDKVQLVSTEFGVDEIVDATC